MAEQSYTDHLIYKITVDQNSLNAVGSAVEKEATNALNRAIGKFRLPSTPGAGSKSPAVDQVMKNLNALKDVNAIGPDGKMGRRSSMGFDPRLLGGIVGRFGQHVSRFGAIVRQMRSGSGGGGGSGGGSSDRPRRPNASLLSSMTGSFGTSANSVMGQFVRSVGFGSANRGVGGFMSHFAGNLPAPNVMRSLWNMSGSAAPGVPNGFNSAVGGAALRGIGGAVAGNAGAALMGAGTLGMVGVAAIGAVKGLKLFTESLDSMVNTFGKYDARTSQAMAQLEFKETMFDIKMARTFSGAMTTWEQAKGSMVDAAGSFVEDLGSFGQGLSKLNTVATYLNPLTNQLSLVDKGLQLFGTSLWGVTKKLAFEGLMDTIDPSHVLRMITWLGSDGKDQKSDDLKKLQSNFTGGSHPAGWHGGTVAPASGGPINFQTAPSRGGGALPSGMLMSSTINMSRSFASAGSAMPAGPKGESVNPNYGSAHGSYLESPVSAYSYMKRKSTATSWWKSNEAPVDVKGSFGVLDNYRDHVDRLLQSPDSKNYLKAIDRFKGQIKSGKLKTKDIDARSDVFYKNMQRLEGKYSTKQSVYDGIGSALGAVGDITGLSAAVDLFSRGSSSSGGAGTNAAGVPNKGAAHNPGEPTPHVGNAGGAHSAGWSAAPRSPMVIPQPGITFEQVVSQHNQIDIHTEDAVSKVSEHLRHELVAACREGRDEARMAISVMRGRTFTKGTY